MKAFKYSHEGCFAVFARRFFVIFYFSYAGGFFMHMADALVSPATGGVMWAAATAAVAYSVNALQKQDILENKKIPVMGVSGAFVFAAQMINFTIPATGSSGHLGGGLLLAALLGPSAGFIVLSVVLAIQALFFADGGLLALGCNIFNMGFFTCYIAYPLIMKPILSRSKTKKSIFAASVSGAVIGMMLGALGVVLETAASGVTELPVLAFASLMLPIHLAIGAAEGIVTALVLVFINDTEPALLENGSPGKTGLKKTLVVLAAAALLLGGGVSLIASEKPDGLEWAMLNTAGTSKLEADSNLHDALSAAQEKTSFLPDYGLKNADGTAADLGGSLAGIVGSAIVLVIVAVLGFCVSLFKRSRRT